MTSLRSRADYFAQQSVDPALARPRRSGWGQGPTKSPIICLASDSRHWGLKDFGKFPCPA